LEMKKHNPDDPELDQLILETQKMGADSGWDKHAHSE
jgi:hypothetical protein